LRQNRRDNGGSDREYHGSDKSDREDDDSVKGTADLVGKVATTVNPVRKVAAATDPMKAMNGRATGRVYPCRACAGPGRGWVPPMTKEA
jgi:hypothetical protein